MSSGPNDLYGKDPLPACLWSSKIPENPFVMETKRGWHQVEDGEIKEGEKSEMMAYCSGRLHSI